MKFTRRVELEMMDDSGLSAAEYHRSLIGFSRLNRLSSVTGAMYRRLASYARSVGQRPIRVLDIASGSADVPIAWATRARRDRLPIQITTIDISQRAIDEQLSAAEAAGVDLHAIQRDCLRDPLPSGFDVVTCSLFMHRLDDRQSVRLLHDMQAAAGHAMIVSDWERSRGNCWMVGAAAHAVSRSVVVRKDAVAGVRSAYTRREFERLAETALQRPIQCQRLVPCRFIMTVDEIAIPVGAPAFA